jgi:hypothetical protein
VKPNVVLVVLDTARATAFEPWGAPVGSTPTVAQLASRGTAVRQAVSASNWTMPSHAAMFAGRLPRSMGLTTPPGSRIDRCYPLMAANRPRLLPDVLHKAGYQTAGSSSNPWVADAHGFAIGFDSFTQVHGKRDAGIADRDVRTRLRWVYEALLARVDQGAAASAEIVDGWLAGPPKPPFFWFINLMECHSPYLPPRPWNDLGPLARVRASAEARRHLTMNAIWRASVGGFDIPTDTLERMRHLYAKSVGLMDAWIGRLLTMLDERHLLDDTIVLVTSDHGENLGESQLIGHAFALNDHLIRVPLVVSGPDPIDLPDFLSTVALPRIIGDAVGLASNPWGRDRDDIPAGIAVAQYDGLVFPDDPRVEQAVSEWQLGDSARVALTQPMTAATDGRRKLVRHGDVLRLYNLAADPDELDPAPVGPTLSPDVQALADAIAAADLTDASPEDIAAIQEIDRGTTGGGAMEEQLRLLGYL